MRMCVCGRGSLIMQCHSAVTVGLVMTGASLGLVAVWFHHYVAKQSSLCVLPEQLFQAQSKEERPAIGLREIRSAVK